MSLLNPFQQSLVLYAGGLTGGGFQGAIGFQGDRGFQGDVGNIGVQGFSGIQGRVGNQGSEGPAGLQGVQGIVGIQGVAGIVGTQGNAGVQGVEGSQGVQGLTNTEFAITTAYQLLGSTIKSVNLNHLTGWLTTAISLSSGTQTFIPVYVQTAATLTGAMFELDTQGAYTASNYNGVGLYSISGGTLTLVASTTNNGDIFKAASGTLLKEPFAVPYSAAVGVYYMSFLYSSSAQTTAPAISGQTANFNLGRADFSNSYVLSGILTGRTTLIASQASSGLSLSNNSTWVNVY